MTSELAIITFSDEVMELPSGSCLCGGTDSHCASLIKLTLTRLNLHVLTVIDWKGFSNKRHIIEGRDSPVSHTDLLSSWRAFKSRGFNLVPWVGAGDKGTK